MEDDSIPPALSPSASSGSSPETMASVDFDMSEQDTPSPELTPLLEPLHAFVANEDNRHLSSPPPPTVRVIEWDPDTADFVLFENDQDDMCLGDEDYTPDRRLNFG